LILKTIYFYTSAKSNYSISRSFNYNLVQLYRLIQFQWMANTFIIKSPSIEVYGHCRLLLPNLRVPSSFFGNQRLKNCWHVQGYCTRDGPWPDQSLLLTQENKRPTRLWPRYFLTRPKDIFWPEWNRSMWEKKMVKKCVLKRLFKCLSVFWKT